MRLALLADDAGAASLRRLLAGEEDVVWVAATLTEARARLGSSPVDALLVVTAALRGDAGSLGELTPPSVLFRSGLAADDAIAYEAMGQGALSTMPLPSAAQDAAAREAALRSLRLALASARPAAPSRAPAGRPVLVAIGASTGGPAALREVLQALRGTRAAIVIVQHIDPTFIPDMATWLAQAAGLPVDLSTQTLEPRPGRALIAAAHEHLVVAADQRFCHEPPRPDDIHHPSVDALFTSLAAHGRPGVAALLTGMGRDGARGLLALRKAGWHTVAQDALSSVVDGMPKAARDLGAACESKPLDQLGSAIRRAIEAAR